MTSSDQYTVQEVENLIYLAASVTERSLLGALAKILEPTHPDLAKTVLDTRKMQTNGYLELEFHETDEYKIRILLAVVAQDYSAVAVMPNNDYMVELYKKYNFIKEMAVAYWKHWSTNNEELVSSIELVLGSSIKELIIDSENPTTMYLTKGAAYRVGLMSLLADKDGNLFDFAKQAK